jgi:hypothetical protein
VFGFIYAVDESQPIVLNESEVAITEVVVIVFNEARDKVGECVLTADADCPSAAGIVIDYIRSGESGLCYGLSVTKQRR